MLCGKICFPFRTKGVYRFRRFNRNRELAIVGAAKEKSRLSIISIVLGTKSCFGNAKEMPMKCSRFPKYVRCWVERVRYIIVANLNLIWYTIGSCSGSGRDGEKRDA